MALHAPPAVLVDVRDRLGANGWLSSLDVIGVGRFSVRIEIPYDVVVGHLHVTDDGCRLTVAAHRKPPETESFEGPVWLVGVNDVDELACSLEWWNESIWAQELIPLKCHS